MISHERQEVVRAAILAGWAASLHCPDEQTSREIFQVSLRSKSTLWPCADHFRCTPDSGHVATPL